MKRLIDSCLSACGLMLTSPILLMLSVMVWWEDRASPFYRGERLGLAGKPFRMVKFRSMRPDAWKSGVNSTAAGDSRITRLGGWLRSAKLDELPQLWNVLTGEMSFVGPRPQVMADASLYTAKEKRMLEVRPGITDLASIVFADEAEILAGAKDPDLLYNQIIRPWKSRLALLYVERQMSCGWKANLAMDAQILWLTLTALRSRPVALEGVAGMIEKWGADPLLSDIVRRKRQPPAYPPPGADAIVSRYKVTNV